MNQFEKLGFALAKSADWYTAPTPSTPSTAHQGSDGGFGGEQRWAGGRKVSPAAIKYTGPGVHGEGRSGPTRKVLSNHPYRVLAGSMGGYSGESFIGGDVRTPGPVNRDRSPRLPSGIDQVNSSATKGPGIQSVPASSSMAIGSALRNADNRQMHGTRKLVDYMHGSSARKALANSAMKQPGSRWVGFNGPRARQASTELMSDLQAGRRLPQVQDRGDRAGSKVFNSKPDTVHLNTGPEEYRQLGMNPTQILMHEIRHTRQPAWPEPGKAFRHRDWPRWLRRPPILNAVQEIPPTTGDLVNAGEIYRRTTGKPLQHTVNYPSGKSHDINWMIDQAKQHGYLDGSKSMTELMATPEGQQWLRSLILRNEGHLAPKPKTVQELIKQLKKLAR